jgi:hypothetical protein
MGRDELLAEYDRIQKEDNAEVFARKSKEFVKNDLPKEVKLNDVVENNGDVDNDVDDDDDDDDDENGVNNDDDDDDDIIATRIN